MTHQTPTDPYVSFRNVNLTYPGGTVGLTDVNLDIAEGEFIALVGPSGSGKTTLLNTLAGVIRPSSGSIAINGETVADDDVFVAPERRHLGMVFQQHALWPHMSVSDNVAYPLLRSGIPKNEHARRIDWALTLVGLQGYGDRNPAELSGGQSQRVAIARAIVAHPRMLLLDEALSALDEPLRESLRLELRRMTGDLNLTALHVTHDRGEAMALADRMVVLDHGHIRQVGTPQELLTQPATPMVASFLNDATLLPGRCEGGIFRADGISLRMPVKLMHAVDGGAVKDIDGVQGTGVLAVMPGSITLTDGDIWRENASVSPQSAASSVIGGVVTASLYGPQVNTVVVQCGDMTLRCTIAGVKPKQGERVGVRLTGDLFYPGVAD